MASLSDAQAAAYSALAIVRRNYFVDVRFKSYAGVKAEAKARGDTIYITMSDAYASASSEVVEGLILSLFSKMFRVRVTHPSLLAYKEFVSSQAIGELHEQLQRSRGRKRKLTVEGNIHNLNEILARIATEYAALLRLENLPKITWSKRASRRVLGYYDAAHNEIVISRSLDSPNTPVFLVEYVVFHELLHAKHDVLYARGKSMRRTVHSAAFKNDERSFKDYAVASAWLSRNTKSVS